MSQLSYPNQLPGPLSPWRRKFQWLTSLLVLLLPWIQPGGNSLLRIDVPSLSLYLFGQVLRIEELFLFLLFCLTFAIGFLLITLVSGRVWCGWACPQTTLNDLAEWFAKQLRLKVVNNRLQGARWRKAMVQIAYLLVALLVAANLLWYFIEPQRFFGRIYNGEMSSALWLTFISLALIVYLDLALLRRLMCKEFCPYGRIQTALVDPATLTLQMPEKEKPRCIKCNSCVRSCPMEIDIRQGYQIECINCGRCLDACRNVMKKRQQPGLIHYTFGVADQGPGALLNPKTILLSLVLICLLLILSLSIYNRVAASLKVSVSHTASSRILKDGQQITFFNAWINNRSTAAEIYRVQARTAAGAALAIKGQTEQLTIAAGRNRKVDFVLLSPAAEQPFMIEFVLMDQLNQQLAMTEAQITPLIK